MKVATNPGEKFTGHRLHLADNPIKYTCTLDYQFQLVKLVRRVNETYAARDSVNSTVVRLLMFFFDRSIGVEDINSFAIPHMLFLVDCLETV